MAGPGRVGPQQRNSGGRRLIDVEGGREVIGMSAVDAEVKCNAARRGVYLGDRLVERLTTR